MAHLGSATCGERRSPTVPKRTREVRLMRSHANQVTLSDLQETIGRPPDERYSAFHLMEQPIDGTCCAGPTPVAAMARIASTSSRRAPAGGGVVRPSSRRPRYLSLPAAS